MCIGCISYHSGVKAQSRLKSMSKILFCCNIRVAALGQQWVIGITLSAISFKDSYRLLSNLVDINAWSFCVLYNFLLNFLEIWRFSAIFSCQCYRNESLPFSNLLFLLALMVISHFLLIIRVTVKSFVNYSFK